VDEGPGEARVLGPARAIAMEVVRRLLRRPAVRGLLEEYLAETSPLVSRYVRRVAEVTGLPEEVVRRSRPVRNLVRSILGD